MKHVILGLLSESPCHGYALKKGISPALSRKQQVNDGILYPLLKNLEKSGLIKSKLKKEAKKPAKKIFSVTPKGKKYFLNWLRQDNDEEEVLYNFMLAEPFFKQCMFLEKLNPKARVTKLKDYLKKTQVKIKKLKTIYQGMKKRGVAFIRIEMIKLGIAQQEAKKSWLQKLIKNYEKEVPIGKTTRY